jgi:hypothetical protein
MLTKGVKFTNFKTKKKSLLIKKKLISLLKSKNEDFKFFKPKL